MMYYNLESEQTFMIEQDFGEYLHITDGEKVYKVSREVFDNWFVSEAYVTAWANCKKQMAA